MDRRSLLKFATLFGAGGVASNAVAAAGRRPSARKPIVLYCDLAVDPARQQEMLRAFHTRFYPAAASFKGRGFIDLKMLKVRSVIQGGPPPGNGVNYRFQLTYESEQQRQVWVKSAIHQQVWPLIENTLLNKDYLVLLTESV
jgi:hypothetical protein